MDMGLKPRPLCGARRGPDARIISPLPNVRLEHGAAVAELVHHAVLEPLSEAGLTGSATLRLRGDELRVCVTADRQVRIDLRHCPGGEDGSARLLLVVTECGGTRLPIASSARFDLSMRDGFAALPQDLAPLSPFDLDALNPNALHGLSTLGWPAAPDRPAAAEAAQDLPALPLNLADDVLAPARGIVDDAYFRRRMKDEIGAALRADQPGVASRHVQIATLLARRLQRQRLQY